MIHRNGYAIRRSSLAGRVNMQATRELSGDALFSTLADSRRRAILNFLETPHARVDMGDLIAHIARLERKSGSVVDSRKLAINLAHCHLPKLVEVGLVEYDRSKGKAARTSLAEQVDPHLALIEG